MIGKTTSCISKNPATSNASTWWICALLILAIFTAYWPVLGYQFTHFDDPVYVWQNPHVLKGLNWSDIVWAFNGFCASNWHPLTWLSHMLDAQLYGMNAGGHHATNLLFHAANTVLLFLWLKRLTGATWRSAMVAALFGLHPLHVESVAWVAERKDVLSTFFFLLTLDAYVRYAELKISQPPSTNRKWKWYALALVFFALGLMSKPMLVTLPFVLLLLDYWPLGRISNFKFQKANFRLLLAEKAPFLLLAAASCAVAFFAQQGGEAVMPMTVMPFEIRIQNALISYLAYLEKMLWPESLAAFYPLHFPIDVDAMIMAAFVLLLISGAVCFYRRQRPYLIVGWLWYLGMLVPVIGLVQVGSQSMADRYTYVPLIGAFIAIVWLAAEIRTEWPYRRIFLIVISVSVLGVCWQLSARQVHYWQNSETLARHALAVTTDNASMEVILGNTLMEQGKFKEAGRHFAEAVKIWPDCFPAQSDLAFALLSQGRLDEAIDSSRAALKLKPDDIQPHYLMGNAFLSQGKLAEAVVEYKTVLAADSNYILALNDFAWLRATAPDPQFRDGTEAVKLAEHCCQLSNYEKPLLVGTLAAAYAEAGRFDDAVTAAQKAMALAAADKNEVLMAKNRELLKLYQDKKAYHKPASP